MKNHTYHLAIAARNTADRPSHRDPKPQTSITDVNINSIKVRVDKAETMNITKDDLEKEKS